VSYTDPDKTIQITEQNAERNTLPLAQPKAEDSPVYSLLPRRDTTNLTFIRLNVNRLNYGTAMTTLMTLLETAQTQVKGNNKAQELLAQALSETRQLLEENQLLHSKVNQLEQIIQDIRELDARKKCLCRGFGS